MGSQDVKILPADSEQASKPAAAGKHKYTEAEKEKMRTDPEAFLKYRKEVDGALQKGFSVFLRGSELNIMAKKGMAEMIRARIGPGHEDLKEKFIPKWSPGCRRMTVGGLRSVFEWHGANTSFAYSPVKGISRHLQRTVSFGLSSCRISSLISRRCVRHIRRTGEVHRDRLGDCRRKRL